MSATIAHKLPLGDGVQIDIGDADALAVAQDDMFRRVRERMLDSSLARLLVSEMIADGVEVIAASLSDPLFGPVLSSRWVGASAGCMGLRL